jgi:hypothetical protein
LTAKILYESGLVQQDTKGNAGWEKIKKFATTYIAADSEKSKIGTYRQELRDAMDMLSVGASEQARTNFADGNS